MDRPSTPPAQDEVDVGRSGPTESQHVLMQRLLCFLSLGFHPGSDVADLARHSPKERRDFHPGVSVLVPNIEPPSGRCSVVGSRWGLDAIIIQGQRPSGHIGGTVYRLRMAVERPSVGREYNGAIGDWQDRFDFFLAVSAPEFERTAKILLPVLVQVDDQVQAPKDRQVPGLGEIQVDREMPAALNLMKTAAIEEGIGDQRAFPSKRFEALQNGRRVQLIH